MIGPSRALPHRVVSSRTLSGTTPERLRGLSGRNVTLSGDNVSDLLHEGSETDPLLDQGPTTSRIEHKDNIYSAALFFPPLTKKQLGHCWSPAAVTGFFLVGLTIVTQVGLTLVAGAHFVSSQYDSMASLRGEESAAHISPWTSMMHQARNTSVQQSVKLRRAAGTKINISKINMSWATRHRNAPDADNEVDDCCRGAACADMGLRCCYRSESEPQGATRPEGPISNGSSAQGMPNFLAGKKPKAKSKKHRTDQSSSSGGSDRAICVERDHGRLFCTPRSYDFLDLWDQLDVDQNGLWTLDEALADEANLGCQFSVPLDDIFRSSCNTIVQEVEDTNKHVDTLMGPNSPQYSVPVSIIQHEALPKEYFDWWSGVVTLCIGFDANRCSEFIGKGIFDGAMRTVDGWTKGAVHDLDSALDYCQRLLEPGGLCESALPGFYRLHRAQVRGQCGKAVLHPGRSYKNPFNNADVMIIMDVKYGNVMTANEHSTFRYRFFLSMILMLWCISVLDEVLDIIRWIDFLCCFPIQYEVPLITPHMRSSMNRAFQSLTTADIRPQRSPGESESEEIIVEKEVTPSVSEDIIQSEKTLAEEGFVMEIISVSHWSTCVFICLLRVWLLLYLFNIGTIFLLSNLGYLDLLLNAVALALIFELPSTMYTILYSDESKKQLAGACTAEYETYLPLKGRWRFLLLKFAWGCVILPCAWCAVDHNYKKNILPVVEALHCACLQEGPNCAVASKLTREWWRRYWTHLGNMFLANYHAQGFVMPHL